MLMTLNQLHSLKAWHLRHGSAKRVEWQLWEAVLTLWLLGWAGIPAALLAGAAWMPLACMGLIALPSAYVLLRSRLHRQRRLRCDWLVLIR
jgi:hypothetical protein